MRIADPVILIPFGRTHATGPDVQGDFIQRFLADKLLDVAEGNHRAGPREQRHELKRRMRNEVLAAGRPFASPKVEPLARRQVNAARDRTLPGDRRDQQIASQQELIADAGGDRVILMMPEQGPHDGRTRVAGFDKQ